MWIFLSEQHFKIHNIFKDLQPLIKCNIFFLLYISFTSYKKATENRGRNVE